MTKQNSTLRKRLKQYSAFAGSIFAFANISNAQVVYKDLDPDLEFDAVNPFPGDVLPFDFNNDGNIDFIFVAFHGSSYNGIGMLPYPTSGGNSNAIMGPLGTFNSAPFAYVSALDAN